MKITRVLNPVVVSSNYIDFCAHKKRIYIGVRWMVILSIIFLHFMWARPAGFPLTLAPFAIIVLICVYIKKTLPAFGLVVGAFLMSWPFVVCAMYLSEGQRVDFLEFIRTYALWAFAISTLVIVTLFPLRKKFSYPKEFLFAMMIVVIYSFMQINAWKMFNSTVFYNPFGNHTYMGEYDVSRWANEYLTRAPAFYLEASFNAFVIFFLTSALMISRFRNKTLALLVGWIGIVISGSASGVLAIGGMTALYLSTKLIKGKLFRLLSIVSWTIIVSLVCYIYLNERFREIEVEGTSGYWRLIGPLIVTRKIFIEFPLGVPFGQIEAFLIPMGLKHGNGVGTSIDNGVAYLAFYFGWLVIPFLIALILKLGKHFFNGNKSGAIYWWYILASLPFSGGILLPEYIFLLAMITLTYRSAKSAGNILCM